jgi:hypothetical protein
MTAALNVYGNVREYDTDLDVFGVVFEWDEPGGNPVAGWTATTQRRHWIATEQRRAWIATVQNRQWTARPNQ